MKASEIPDHLEQVPIEEVPRGQLYELKRAIVIDGRASVEAGKSLVVRHRREMPLETAYILQEIGRRAPDIAYHIIRTHELVLLILMHDKIHDGEGEVFGSDNIAPETRGLKANIRPSLITAERVPPVKAKIKDLPKGNPLVLGRAYYETYTGDNSALLSEAPKGIGEPEEGELDVEVVNFFVEDMVLRRGDHITLQEKDGKFFFRRSTENGQPTSISGDCEIWVSVPKEAEKSDIPQHEAFDMEGPEGLQ